VTGPVQRRRRPFWPWFAPALLVLGGFYLIPILDVVRLAFGDATLLRAVSDYDLDSFTAILSSPALPGILRTTIVFTGLNVLGLLLVGLMIALLVARGDRRGLSGMAGLRTIVLMAWVIPGIANGLIWQMLFSEAPFGAINSALRMAGAAPVAWLSDPRNALLSAVIANVWQGAAFSMVIFYAARRAIDPGLYEAAAVDGISAPAQFWFITLPQLRPAILVATVLVTIQTLNTFDAILSLTGGGPGRATEVLSLHTFNTVFYNLDLSGGSVLALILVVLSMILTAVYAATLWRSHD
jgi:multiple sugar transport system permease protein